jgi:hypothetical protein
MRMSVLYSKGQLNTLHICVNHHARISSSMNGGISPPLTKHQKTTRTAPNLDSPLPATSSSFSADALRIFSWNINGIEPILQKSIAMLLLQEVKITSRDIKTPDAVRTAINISSTTMSHNDPAYEAHSTLPSNLHNARGLNGNGKIYGVCSILQCDLRNERGTSTRTVDWNNGGRVSLVELESTHHKLATFNIYAANSTDYAYRDLTTDAVRGVRHNR